MTPRFLALGTEKTGAPILIGNEWGRRDVGKTMSSILNMFSKRYLGSGYIQQVLTEYIYNFETHEGMLRLKLET